MMTGSMRFAVALALVGGGCGFLGGSDEFTQPMLPNSGVGLFRPLEENETGFDAPSGRFMSLGAVAFDGSTLRDGVFLFGAAALVDTETPQDPNLRSGEVDWALFEPRRIHVGTSIAVQGYGLGEVVFRAAEAWEGGWVSQPDLVRTREGQVRLYYAAAGGIGVAEAADAMGPFNRITRAPVLGGLPPGPGEEPTFPSNPSVVVDRTGRYLLYYEEANDIRLAISDTGLSFERVTLTFLEPEEPLEPDVLEVAREGPSAVLIRTVAKREVVRLYFESIRANGRRYLMFAGSDDASTFQRSELPVMDEPNLLGPSATLLDDLTTLLHFAGTATENDVQVRAPRVAVFPEGVTFTQ